MCALEDICPAWGRWRACARRARFTSAFRRLLPATPMRALAITLAASLVATAAAAQNPTLPNETPAKFTPARSTFDFDRREVMIPMRDGVKLHTVILVPKG